MVHFLELLQKMCCCTLSSYWHTLQLSSGKDFEAMVLSAKIMKPSPFDSWTNQPFWGCVVTFCAIKIESLLLTLCTTRPLIFRFMICWIFILDEWILDVLHQLFSGFSSYLQEKSSFSDVLNEIGRLFIRSMRRTMSQQHNDEGFQMTASLVWMNEV